MAVVTVKRKGHPCGTVRVEEADRLPSDVVVADALGVPIEQPKKRGRPAKGDRG